MRLIFKASLILLITVVVQYVISGQASGGTLDEAQFAMRVYVAKLAGDASNDPVLLDAAWNLQIRQEERNRRLHPERWRMAQAPTAMRNAFGTLPDVG